LELLVANPWFTGKTSAAALIRKIDAEAPTLLLDESDSAFHSDREYAEALRGLLVTGHRIGGKASLCVGEGKDIHVRDFSTFSPKAIAGLGKLPDTVADRSLPILLKRAARGEIHERFRRRSVEPEATELRERLENWADRISELLGKAEPYLPEALTDRQQDGAEPLLAIADAAGGDWPYRFPKALVSVFAGADHAESTRTRLLRDIRGIFETKDIGRIPSMMLVGELAQIETSPWGEWRGGRAITSGQLARLLAPFGIAPHTVRVEDHTPRGYEVADFEEVWARYLPQAENATTQQPAKNKGNSQIEAATENLRVAPSNQQKNQ
jgi:hypothetical protein